MSRSGFARFLAITVIVTGLVSDGHAQAPSPAAATKPVPPTANNGLPPIALPQAAPQPMPATAGMNPTELAKELLYRSSLGRGDDVKLLIKQGAAANATNDAKVPLLSLAAARKDSEAVPVMDALLAGGADVNAKDANGQTALFYAARSGNKISVELLLRKGIDYYSLDNFGDIARTVAFRAERKDIVDMMDNFVRAQSERALNLNEATNKLAMEQIAVPNALPIETPEQKAIREAQEAREKAEREAQLAREKAERERQEAEARRIAEEKAKREEEEAKRIYAENVVRLRTQVTLLAYNACAFQYWSYCQSAAQTTVLDDNRLTSTIKSHQIMAERISMDIMEMMNVDQKYTANIIEGSKTRIYDELEAMPSRTARKQLGVGTMEDVKKRCDIIANSWQVDAPK